MADTRNAKITSVRLEIEDHGILTGWLGLDYGSSCQSFGGYSLGGEACALFVRRCMEVVGTRSWEDLVGKSVRVRAEHSRVIAIGNFLKEDWFDIASEMKEL